MPDQDLTWQQKTARAFRPRDSRIFERQSNDWYQEPLRATQDLLAHEKFVGLTWDPSCGGGNVCRAFDQAGLPIIGSDIAYRLQDPPHWWFGIHDFMESMDELSFSTSMDGVMNLVCNPPFLKARGTEFFIRKAVKHVRGKIAIFADLKFLASGGRANGLYQDMPPHRIWHTGTRYSCPPGDYIAEGGKVGGGTQDWVWLVWNMAEPLGRTETRWFCTQQEAA